MVEGPPAGEKAAVAGAEVGNLESADIDRDRGLLDERGDEPRPFPLPLK